MSPWNTAKAKVQLRLSVQRLRTLQQKKEAQAKASRRDIAVLLEKGKMESARVKVEAIINEDINLELLELLELYCELLVARFGLLDQLTREPDPGISEGVCAIIHAAPRTEVKELQSLREYLMYKYGREFSMAVMENRGQCVSDRVMKKLVVETPSSMLVEAYLAEIASGYGVKWTSPTVDGKGAKETTPEPSATSASASASGEDSTEQLPAYSVPSPKLPNLPLTEDNEKAAIPKDVPKDDFEALTRRFHDLKKH